MTPQHKNPNSAAEDGECLLLTEFMRQIVQERFTALHLGAHFGHFVEFARPFPAAELLAFYDIQSVTGGA
jgi:hypothetical protein